MALYFTIAIVILISTTTELKFGSTAEWGSVGHKMDGDKGSTQFPPYSHMAFWGLFFGAFSCCLLHITFHPQIAFLCKNISCMAEDADLESQY